LIFNRPKQSLNDILNDASVSKQKAWEEAIREMKGGFVGAQLLPGF
jgi:hypothetical protein